MSYILEALKKSQQERQIGHVPDITQMQDVPLLRPAPRWPRWLLAALLLNAVILVVLAWRSWESRRVAVESEPSLAVVPPAPSPAVNPVPRPRVEIPAAPAIVAPAPEASSSPEPAPVPTQSVTQMPPAVEAMPPLEPAPPVAEAAPELQPELPPRWQDLPLEERTGLPAPRIDVHVFDQEPERRFVLINLHKYQVGDTLDGGATIDAILADGIMLSYGGRKYRVDRP